MTDAEVEAALYKLYVEGDRLLREAMNQPPSTVFEFSKSGAIRGIEMTNELTLREKVMDVIGRRVETAFDLERDMDALIAALEDTGSPAHMRVAAELRGE